MFDEVLEGRYSLISVLGEGAYGRVYLAAQLTTGQRVAIKALRLRHAGLPIDVQIARFKREMKLCAELHHPNIVRLIDSGTENDQLLFLVFEYVPGELLGDRLRAHGPLEIPDAIRLMGQVLDALGCAHANGVVHRDLKPQNIMITTTGPRPNAMVLDFGTGAILDAWRAGDLSPLTAEDELIGTPAYAAPEQLRGEAPSPCSDLYSWGLVLLECLTGERAIVGNSPMAAAARQLEESTIVLPDRVRTLPIAAVLEAVLRKDPRRREADAKTLLEQLERIPVLGSNGSPTPLLTPTLTQDDFGGATLDTTPMTRGRAELTKPQDRLVKLTPGQLLGDYELVDELDKGGMGEVFIARRIDSLEQVALKVLSKVSPTQLVRFKREFRSIAGLSHPNLIELHELVVDVDNVAFITMELLAGVPFVAHVRDGLEPRQMPDLARVRESFMQLLDGLEFLHRSGWLHRDLKPSNVLVTAQRVGRSESRPTLFDLCPSPAGHSQPSPTPGTRPRVVILDLGLAAEYRELSDPHRERHLAGTPAYMAPEQIEGGALGPRTDLYAVGVMLYESLTGLRPHTGTSMQVLVSKLESGQVVDPRVHNPSIPGRLARMCNELLQPRLDDRPSLAELVACLDELVPTGTATPNRVARWRLQMPFLGRSGPLEQLATAHRDVAAHHRPVTVHLRGPGGIGKSALLRQFLQRTQTDGSPVLLRGRCFERESVPYKGVDALVDELSALLRELPPPLLAKVAPTHVRALTRIFPVLDGIWTPGPPELAATTDVAALEPGELRDHGIASLREILVKLSSSAHAPIILCIDDFHWADIDSARMLAALLRPPAAPALLLLVSFDAHARDSDAVVELRSPELTLGRDIRTLELGALPFSDALALADELLRSIGHADAERAGTIAQHTGGHPFYIQQMALDVDSTGAVRTLAELIARRLERLDEPARALLELIAVAGGRLAVELARQAFPDVPLTTTVEQLSEQGLMVNQNDDGSSTERDRAEELELAQGQLRDALIAGLEGDALANLHLRLAELLGREDTEPEILADHFELGGRPERALEYVERAAERAAFALAFARAVELYRRALTLLDRLPQPDPVRRRSLREGLAAQLVNLGHSHEAGTLLRELADDAAPERALAFRRQAAEQLLHAGKLDEGLELAAAVLRSIGEPVPRGFWPTLGRLVWERLRLRLRGGSFELRSEPDIPAEQLLHIDSLRHVYTGLALHGIAHAEVLRSRLFRQNLDIGEPYRLGLAMATELPFLAATGRSEQATQLLSTCRDVAASADNELELHQTIDFITGIVYYVTHRYREAADCLGEMLTVVDTVRGQNWLLFVSVLAYTRLCLQIGRWNVVTERLPQWLATARERGNLRELAELEAYLAATHFHRGELAEANQHLEAGREAWRHSPYTTTTLMLDYAEGLILLTSGDPARITARLDEIIRDSRNAGITRLSTYRRYAERLYLRCHIELAMHAPMSAKIARRTSRIIKRHRRSKDPIARGESMLSEAALRSLAGDHDGARQRWRTAELIFAEHGIEAHLAAVRWRLARTVLGEESRRLNEQANRYFESQKLENPDWVSSCLAPAAGDALLESSQKFEFRNS